MATTDWQTGATPPEETLSEPMRRVLEAIVAGEPVPLDAHAALTPAERNELAALARTANLTYLTLQQPDASPDAEQRSLEIAQRELARRPARPPAPDPEPRPFLLAWLDRLRRKTP
ncbi:MAG: hypothetical protein SFU56_02510 [Capsulimonadales bacterium]|nr:hypothetical protein [Capsulimonadales bacterium]